MANHMQFSTSNAPICRDRNAGSRKYTLTTNWEEVTCKACLKQKGSSLAAAAQPAPVNTYLVVNQEYPMEVHATGCTCRKLQANIAANGKWPITGATVQAAVAVAAADLNNDFDNKYAVNELFRIMPCCKATKAPQQLALPTTHIGHQPLTPLAQQHASDIFKYFKFKRAYRLDDEATYGDATFYTLPGTYVVASYSMDEGTWVIENSKHAKAQRTVHAQGSLQDGATLVNTLTQLISNAPATKATKEATVKTTTTSAAATKPVTTNEEAAAIKTARNAATRAKLAANKQKLGTAKVTKPAVKKAAKPAVKKVTKLASVPVSKADFKVVATAQCKTAREGSFFGAIAKLATKPIGMQALMVALAKAMKGKTNSKTPLVKLTASYVRDGYTRLGMLQAAK